MLKGTGARNLAMEIRGYRILGVRRIVALADGSASNPKGPNGYYTWLRLGFNAPLTDRLIQKFEAAGFPIRASGVNDLQGVFETYGLHAFQAWKNYLGEPIPVVFDLNPGSKCIHRLARYIKEKSIRL